MYEFARSTEDQENKTVREAFEEYKYVLHEHSEQSRTWYVGRLVRFVEWCERRHLVVSKIRPMHVAMYLEELRKPSKTTGRPLATSTVHGHMRLIRTFLYWCAKPLQGYLWIEVPRALVMPRIEKVVIKPFSIDQIKALQVAVTKNHYPILIARDKAILAVLLDTGIRANELCTLTLDHVYITSKEAYLLVRGKGLKQREVPLGTQSRQLLEAYIRDYRPVNARTKRVFLGHKQEPMTINSLSQTFGRWEKRAKITGVRCSPHDCRHTYAINYLMQGGDVYVLSLLMGHASVSTTEMYLRAVKAIQARTLSKSVLDHLFDNDLGAEHEVMSLETKTFLVGERSVKDTQEECLQWATFFRVWYEQIGNTWMFTSQVLNELLDVLPDDLCRKEREHERAHVFRLGTALRNRSDTSYGEERFSVRGRYGPRGMNQWQVYQVPPAR